MMDTPLSMFCYQRSTSHPLFPPSVSSSLPCFTLVLTYCIPPQNLNMIFQVWLHQKGNGKFFQSHMKHSMFWYSALAKLNHVKLVCETEFCITKSYFVWYTQQLIVADTVFYVPRSSSGTHQVSDWHSNLVTTPSSSIDLTSQSVLTFCNLKSTMFHFGVDLLYSTTEPQHDLPSLASPKGKWQVLSVPHEALYVLVTLHLQSSIMSSWCVKLSFVSPSLILTISFSLITIILMHNPFDP